MKTNYSLLAAGFRHPKLLNRDNYLPALRFLLPEKEQKAFQKMLNVSTGFTQRALQNICLTLGTIEDSSSRVAFLNTAEGFMRFSKLDARTNPQFNETVFTTTRQAAKGASPANAAQETIATLSSCSGMLVKHRDAPITLLDAGIRTAGKTGSQVFLALQKIDEILIDSSNKPKITQAVQQRLFEVAGDEKLLLSTKPWGKKMLALNFLEKMSFEMDTIAVKKNPKITPDALEATLFALQNERAVQKEKWTDFKLSLLEESAYAIFDFFKATKEMPFVTEQAHMAFLYDAGLQQKKSLPAYLKEATAVLVKFGKDIEGFPQETKDSITRTFEVRTTNTAAHLKNIAALPKEERRRYRGMTDGTSLEGLKSWASVNVALATFAQRRFSESPQSMPEQSNSQHIK